MSNTFTQEELRDLDDKFFKLSMEVMDEMSNEFWRNYEEDLERRRRESTPELPAEKPCEPAPMIIPQPAEIEPMKKSAELPSQGETKPRKSKKKWRKLSPHSGPKNANVWDYIENALQKKSK